MKIILNNNKETFDESGITVDHLLKIKNYTFKMLIIKINGILIPKGAYETTTIHEGDDVSVLHLISGG